MDAAESTGCEDADTGKMSEDHGAGNGRSSTQLVAGEALRTIRDRDRARAKLVSYTNPVMYPKSRRETLRGFGRSTRAASSFVLSPTRGTPSRIPMVAGTPPFARMTDSKWNARSRLSGYGKPERTLVAGIHGCSYFIPWVYIVDSRATTGCFAATASRTSSEIWTWQLAVCSSRCGAARSHEAVFPIERSITSAQADSMIRASVFPLYTILALNSQQS